MQRATYVVVYTAEAIDGSGVAAAIHQGHGEEFFRAYLETKLPAGSPYKVRSVQSVEVAAETFVSDDKLTGATVDAYGAHVVQRDRAADMWPPSIHLHRV